jgi:hypothetical protein
MDESARHVDRLREAIIQKVSAVLKHFRPDPETQAEKILSRLSDPDYEVNLGGPAPGDLFDVHGLRQIAQDDNLSSVTRERASKLLENLASSLGDDTVDGSFDQAWIEENLQPAPRGPEGMY